jgi:hypothetical protein
MRCQPQFATSLLDFYTICANFSVVIHMKMLNGQLRVNTFFHYFLRAILRVHSGCAVRRRHPDIIIGDNVPFA